MSGRIEADLENLHKGLLRSQEILNSFSSELDCKLKSAVEEFSSLSKFCNTLKIENKSGISEMLNSEISKWSSALEECRKFAEKNIRGKEFQNKFQKKPLVIVFGVVKAGKSTLGNFLLGRPFRDAGFDNFYKHIVPFPKIHVEEKGRQDASEKDFFDQNSIESTCSVQYFEIPGLVWVDTPGTGAEEKKEIDIRPLEEIAKQYVQYADLVVFLANSANPGINEDVANYVSISDSGKRALILITRSDTYKHEADLKTGKMVKTLIAKDPQRRKEQEAWLLDAMSQKNIKINNTDTVSISTQLAEKAIKDLDDNAWEASNMGNFYKKITDVISSEEILDLKKSNPRQNLNQTINKIVGSEQGENNLYTLINSMKEKEKLLASKYNDLAPQGELTNKITDDVIIRFRSVIGNKIESIAATVKESGTFSLDSETKKCFEKAVSNSLYEHVKKILGDYDSKSKAIFNCGNVQADMKHKKDTHSYEANVPHLTDRDPDGIIEHVKSWFGKKYYKVTYEKETRTIDIDLGVDTSAVKKAIVQQLEERTIQYVQTVLSSIRDEFFKASLDKLKNLIEQTEKMKNRLEDLRYLK